jgi:hypothetical protein
MPTITRNLAPRSGWEVRISGVRQDAFNSWIKAVNAARERLLQAHHRAVARGDRTHAELLTDALARWDATWKPREHRHSLRQARGMSVDYMDAEGRPVTLEVAQIGGFHF